jgi:hypothetical protein
MATLEVRLISARLISAQNPADGVIVARFNRAMLQDVALGSLQSWGCVPASDTALPIALTEVVLTAAYPEMALLRYVQGAGDYTLSVAGVVARDGVAVNPGFASVPLTVTRPGDVDPTVRLFDSVWGPLGIAQGASLRRTVDQLVANRALALGVNQQLQQRLAASGPSAGRDGRPGLGRG